MPYICERNYEGQDITDLRLDGKKESKWKMVSQETAEEFKE